MNLESQKNYNDALCRIDDVVINLVGIRHEIEFMPHPIALSVLTRAIEELKVARSLYLKSNTVVDSNNQKLGV